MQQRFGTKTYGTLECHATFLKSVKISYSVHFNPFKFLFTMRGYTDK